MIADVKRKIQKEVTLALAERARDESTALPTDLWKHVVGRCLAVIHLGLWAHTHLLGWITFGAVFAGCSL